MYQVNIYQGPDDEEGVPIHLPNPTPIKVTSGVVKQGMNTIDTFTFGVNLKSPAWGIIRPLHTLIKVIDTKNNRVEFSGRILKPKGSMSEQGSFAKEFVSESLLGYLLDSVQRHMEFRGTITEYLLALLEVHNRQVESHKRFKLGEVTVVDTNDYIYRYASYGKTFKTIQEDLLDSLGGYLIVREEEDGLYLDYLAEPGIVREMPIEIAQNMQSMTYEIDPSKVVTRLIPLGATIDSEDENATDASQARITIEEVNGGVDYLEDLELQEEFGIVEDTVIWDDVTNASRLMTNGKEWLANQRAVTASFAVSALNLSLINQNFEEINRYDYYCLRNPVLNIEEFLQVVGKTLDILNPHLSNVEIGDKTKTLSEYQNMLRKEQRGIEFLQSTVSRLSARVATATQTIAEAQNTILAMQQTLEGADLDNLDQFKQEISNQLNSLFDNITEIGGVVIELRIEFDEHMLTFNEYKETQAQEIQKINERLDRLEGGGEESIG